MSHNNFKYAFESLYAIRKKKFCIVIKQKNNFVQSNFPVISFDSAL